MSKMSEHLNFLLEMGFSQALAERALKETGNQGIEAAMDWIMAHNEESTPQAKEPSETTLETKTATSGEAACSEGSPPEAKSIKCDECNKLFRTPEEVEFHAAKTGHSQFSESTDEKKPLTEEEKQDQLKKLEEKLKQKRREREEREKAEQLEREKQRIQCGKELSLIKKKLEDDQIRKLADDRRREKEEEKRARQRVKEQIEADKLARKLKFAQAECAPEALAPSAPKPTSVPSQPKEYKETRIQIRLTDGSALTHSFGVKEQLASVRLFIQMNRTDVPSGSAQLFRLQTNFPRKVFNEEDFDKPLDVLGLVPSAVLMVSKM